MGKPSKAIMNFMEQYKIDFDEIWEVHGSTWVVKHKALERVAAEQGIVWSSISKVEHDLEKKIACWMVEATLGERREMDIGEAAPYNNKNGYPSAMALKRGKDRVILKLLAAHGTLYSEAEADEFVQPRQNPHVNRAEDFHEEFSNDIPDAAVPKMKVKDARPAYAALVKEMQRIQDPQELYEWGVAKAPEIHALSGDWPQHFKGEYSAHKAAITNGAA